jgi:hypothetical protein
VPETGQVTEKSDSHRTDIGQKSDRAGHAKNGGVLRFPAAWAAPVTGLKGSRSDKNGSCRAWVLLMTIPVGGDRRRCAGWHGGR